eukprot:TRINITY_DN610_c0_g3_i1.p1 TRINITY_DN610_c0_g3~~TRINITY_DN610_c0_g3_i1.p1  ORF type:complete len:570 (+),score=48.69 TRINITY_DN610_c0_g3_i1:167-1711(+)
MVINVLGGIEALGTLATSVAIERDWVVVVALNSEDERCLVQLNTVMMRINLVCKLLAPACVGFLMSATSPIRTAYYITVWNLLSGMVEYTLYMLVYKELPALANKKLPGGQSNDRGIEDPPPSSTTDGPSSAGHWRKVGEEETDDGYDRGSTLKRDDTADVEVVSATEASGFQEGTSALSESREQNLEVTSVEHVILHGVDPEIHSEEHGSAPLLSDDPAIRSNVPTGEARTNVRDSLHPDVDFAAPIGEPRSAIQKVISGLNSALFGFLTIARATLHFLVQFSAGCRVYARQTSFLAAIAFAFLWLTVLSFDALMTAELQWKGVHLGVLGVCRGLAALTGLLGSVLYPIYQLKWGTEMTGLAGIWSQLGFLVFCVVGMISPGTTSSVLLIVGVIFSRTGLWVFDLAANQIIQESVVEEERGVVGGVQGALQYFFLMLSYVAGMVISDPRDFWKLGLLSFGMVSLAAVVYTCHVGIGRVLRLFLGRNFMQTPAREVDLREVESMPTLGEVPEEV